MESFKDTLKEHLYTLDSQPLDGVYLNKLKIALLTSVQYSNLKKNFKTDITMTDGSVVIW